MNLLHNMKNKKNRKGGFTLVELIVVLVILAILAALLVPALTGYIDKAKEKQVVAETRSLLTAVQTEMSELYATDTWTKLGTISILAAKDGTTGTLDSNISSADLIDNYNRITSLAEVPSLLSDRTGRFCCVVNKETGKIHCIIYDASNGYTGLYFAETSEYMAVKTPESNDYLSSYNCKVVVTVIDNRWTQTFWDRDVILSILGYSNLI